MKKLLSLLLALTMSLSLTIPALAADKAEAEDAAWTLYHLGLFQGTGTDPQGFPLFDLDKAPTRAEGVTMLVRLLGQEDAAKAGQWTTPFTDVPDWAAPYVGYAYANGLTNGTGETTFAPSAPITATQYLTFVLRALGYESGTDFAWDSAWTLSDQLKITDGDYNGDTNASFLRGDVAVISLSALDAKDKTTGEVLKDKLAKLGFDGGDYYRCQVQEEILQVYRNEMAFAFNAVEKTKEKYTKFVVNSVTINGVPCTLEQWSTPSEVKKQCQTLTKEHGFTVTLPDALGLVVLTYDEAKALAAAADSITISGQAYPILNIKFHCTGTLKDGTQVTELSSRNYYINGYGGKYGDIF